MGIEDQFILAQLDFFRQLCRVDDALLRRKSRKTARNHELGQVPTKNNFECSFSLFWDKRHII